MAVTGTVSGNVTATASLRTTKTSGLPSGSSAVSAITFPFPSSVFTNGAGALAMNQLWSSGARALAGGASENLDCAGTLLDEFGNTMGFARLKLIAVYNRGTVAIQIGAGATNGLVTAFPTASAGAIIPAGGSLLMWCVDATGWVVTAATGDIIKVLNLDGAVAASYDILLGGSIT